MKKCFKCGRLLEDNAKFCGYCGTPCLDKQEIISEKEFNGACPKCGAKIDSSQTICPFCGYEFKSNGSHISSKQFSNLLNVAATFEDKISLIKTYAIPNTKEEILEFAILASLNIEEPKYQLSNDEEVINDKYNDEQKLNNAWISKLEQVYLKARLVIKDTREFKEVECLYNEKVKAIREKYNASAKKAARKKFAVEFFPYGIVIAILFLVFIMILFL